MKTVRQLITLCLVVGVIVMSTVGCASGKPEKKEKEQSTSLRVAMVLPGSAADGGYNQTAYEGLKALEDKLGIEVAFCENTPIANYEQAFRDFATSDFDVIIGHGFQFGEVAMKVAPDFPQIKFLVTNNPIVSGENIASLQPKSWEAAYLAGVVAGYVTKSNKVTGIAGYEFPIIVEQMEAFKLGAQSVNPKADVSLVYIGTQDDVAKGKEAGMAAISAGTDVLYHIADAAGVGVINAAKEAGVWAIGWGKDQSYLAPQNVITTQVMDFAKMLDLAISEILAGQFEGKVHFYGLETGVTGLTDFRGLVPEDVVQKVEDVKNGIMKGNIVVPRISTPSS